MTFIGSNIASSSGVGSSEGPSVSTWISLTSEEHLQNFKRMISKANMDQYEKFNIEEYMKPIAKVIEALRMDPCGDIDHLLVRIPRPLFQTLSKSTPLHWAVWMDDRVMVRYILISGKVNINAITSDGESALRFAIICGNHEIVEDLLEYKADVFKGGALESMVHEKDSMFGILKRILTDNVNACDETKKTALHHAAMEGYTDVVAYLLNEKADVNLEDKYGYTPLHCAVNSNFLDVVKLLLQQNVDVNAVHQILRQSLLHFAAISGSTNIVSLPVDHNADVDAVDDDGMTPLLHSLVCRKVDTFNALLVAGANVNIKDKSGNNALHFAIQDYDKNNNMMDIVKLLRKCDVDANAKNSQGYSPFFAAVVKGHTEVVKELLRSKEKIKLMEECNGETAIQIAFNCGHELIKRVLLEYDDVSRYVETLYRDRQVYVDAANAILVGAALIASVTFASWLQPPIGLHYFLFRSCSFKLKH